jgi:hypothetical protein
MECSQISFDLIPKPEMSVSPCPRSIGRASGAGLVGIVDNYKAYQVHSRDVEPAPAGGYSQRLQVKFKRAHVDRQPNSRRSNRISGELDRTDVSALLIRARTQSATCDRCTGKTVGAHIRVTCDVRWLDFRSGLQNGAIQGSPRSAMNGCIRHSDNRAFGETFLRS